MRRHTKRVWASMFGIFFLVGNISGVIVDLPVAIKQLVKWLPEFIKDPGLTTSQIWWIVSVSVVTAVGLVVIWTRPDAPEDEAADAAIPECDRSLLEVANSHRGYRILSLLFDSRNLARNVLSLPKPSVNWEYVIHVLRIAYPEKLKRLFNNTSFPEDYLSTVNSANRRSKGDGYVVLDTALDLLQDTLLEEFMNEVNRNDPHPDGEAAKPE